MSKAFTKEDNDNAADDLLPERAVSPHPNLVTAEGLVQIATEVSKSTAEQISAMRAGDDAAAARASRDLRYWNSRLASAILTESSSTAEVRFGSRVEIKISGGETKKYRIVGTDEGDPPHGLLSYTAPLAQALMGKAIGDVVMVAGKEAEIVTIA